MHAAVSSSVKKPSTSTVSKVCYPIKTATSAAIRSFWGTDNEETARQAYVTLTAPQHTNPKVERCGFIINPLLPEVGESPDGLVHCTCCGKGCLEMKCTFKHHNSILQACADDSKFCLQVTKRKLKQTHKYYKHRSSLLGHSFVTLLCGQQKTVLWFRSYRIQTTGQHF